MKIIVESHIPFVGDLLDPLGEVAILSPEEIDATSVADADALIVRTRTRCNAAMLDGSRVRFVATATIGTDHIDLPWCAAHGIKVVNVPGCNAPAVAQYVWASVFRLLGGNATGKTIGVVGLGHVGSLVAEWGARLGAHVLACDPPRAEVQSGWNPASPFCEGTEPFVPLERIADEADIVTFHTPLTRSGSHPTFHIADGDFFGSLRRSPIVINAARGPVVDTSALIAALREGKVSHAVVDCWEGEPHIDPDLLAMADIATPHIAGYSVEGKQRATAACIAELYRFVGKEDMIPAGLPVPAPSLSEKLTGDDFARHIIESYNPSADTSDLKLNPDRFENLRNFYSLRHEA